MFCSLTKNGSYAKFKTIIPFYMINGCEVWSYCV